MIGLNRVTVELLPGVELAIHRHHEGGRVCAVLTWHDWPDVPYGDAAGLGATEAEALADLAQKPDLIADLQQVIAGCAAMAGYFERGRQ